MKTKDGFIQGYNAQAAVDATAQVIVAHGLDAKQSDQHQLAPMADAIEVNLGKKPAQLSADAGYCSDANLAAMEQREIDPYIAPGRAKHAAEGDGGGARVAAMRAKIKADGHASPYRLRKQLPEPVFGQIKQARQLPPVPLARRREGRRRMGPRLPRPQCLEAGPGADFVPGRPRNRMSHRQSRTKALPERVLRHHLGQKSQEWPETPPKALRPPSKAPAPALRRNAFWYLAGHGRRNPPAQPRNSSDDQRLRTVQDRHRPVIVPYRWADEGRSRVRGRPRRGAPSTKSPRSRSRCLARSPSREKATRPTRPRSWASAAKRPRTPIRTPPRRGAGARDKAAQPRRSPAHRLRSGDGHCVRHATPAPRHPTPCGSSRATRKAGRSPTRRGSRSAAASSSATARADASAGEARLPYPFRSGAELLARGRENGLSIAELMRANEAALRPKAQSTPMSIASST